MGNKEALVTTAKWIGFASTDPESKIRASEPAPQQGGGDRSRPLDLVQFLRISDGKLVIPILQDA